MKIIQTLDTLGRGGAEIQVLDICRNARDFGLDMSFVSFGTGDLEKEFSQLEIPTIKLSRRLPLDPHLIFQLRNIVLKQRADIIHCYQPVEALHAYFATLGLKTKRVLSFQGFIQDEKNRRVAQFLIPRMHANIVVSEGLKSWLRDEMKLSVERNFHVIYNGADEKRLIGRQPTLRRELSLDESALLFGMIGNFYADPRKDQMTICKSLPRIFSEVPEARCVFVGRVEQGAEEKFKACVEFCREKKIADRVYFLGARSDVPEILASLDLFVFSSLHEGLPLAVCEAMLAGVPTVLSDIQPLLEISQNGRYAIIFKTQDENDLAEKVIRILKAREKRQNLGQRAKEFALKNFSLSAHIERLKRLYSGLMTEHISKTHSSQAQ